MLKFLTKESDSEIQLVQAEKANQKEITDSSVFEFTDDRAQIKKKFSIQSCVEKVKKHEERDFCQLTDIPKRSQLPHFRKTTIKPLEPENIVFERSFTRGSSFKSFGNTIFPSPKHSQPK